MLVERWRRIESLFLEALEKSVDQRDVFLSEVCAGDQTMRREIESLLEHEVLARGFLESHQSGAPPRPHPIRDPELHGEHIGPYTVLDQLGAGGMGEVYKGRDERLDRYVAIKFIARRMAGDAASLERFGREARAASALNHPNICTVYDVGEWERRPFLVMECWRASRSKSASQTAPCRRTRPPPSLDRSLLRWRRRTRRGSCTAISSRPISS